MKSPSPKRKQPSEWKHVLTQEVGGITYYKTRTAFTDNPDKALRFEAEILANEHKDMYKLDEWNVTVI